MTQKKARRTETSQKQTLSFDEKYELYEKAVQCPDFDTEFFDNEYRKLKGKEAQVFREDFCGTGAISCEWVKRGAEKKAIGIDLDPLPIQYGKRVHYSRLNDEQQSRMEYIEGNVLECEKYKADIVAALNFSYFIFKERKQLVEYFKRVKSSLNKDGVFFLDIFGGTDCQIPNEDITEHDEFSYYWDCDEFNPITNECLFKIHFKPKGYKKRVEDVFVYDWRMWSIAEVKDALLDAGFSDVAVFWEGDDDDGGGDGEYEVTDEAENCEAWVSYIAALV